MSSTRPVYQNHWLLSEGVKTVPDTDEDAKLDHYFGAPEHREVARAAVRESLVLLKNESSALPITGEKYRVICVAVSKADDFGVQAGAWTVGWQGSVGNANKTSGAVTILDGVTTAATRRDWIILIRIWFILLKKRGLLSPLGSY